MAEFNARELGFNLALKMLGKGVEEPTESVEQEVEQQEPINEMAGVEAALTSAIQVLIMSLEQQKNDAELLRMAIERSNETTNQLIAILAAPKRIVSDKDGNPIGVEVG